MSGQIVTGKDVVENGSTKQGTVKIDVSTQVKAELLHIKNTEGHLTMDGAVRSRLTLDDLRHMDSVRNNDRPK